MITGLSGLATYDAGHGLARALRVAGPEDITVVRHVGPPTEVEVQATGTDANDYGKLTVYWKAAPGATGYNIYRGTTSGGQDYENPVNGGTPWNTPSYEGSSKFAFTDTGLTIGQEYFYTVKAVRAHGESAPSFEDSDIPDPYAIPWDSDDAYAITAAAEYMYGYAADLTRVVGPDGTVYCSQLGVLRPGGEVDLGVLRPGTNLLDYSNGTSVPVPDDGNEFGYGQEEAGMQLLSSDESEVLPFTDGPVRRVRSKDTCTGSYGGFAPGWRNQVYMSPWYPNDTYYTYLGSHWKAVTPQGPVKMDIDAGLQWSRVYNMYNPYFSLKHKRPDGDLITRILVPWQQPIRFDTSYFSGIAMCYALQPYPFSRGSVPMLRIDGYDQYWISRSVLLAAANPIKTSRGMMKRVHSIAQGGPKRCRNTGSYFQYAAFSYGMLRDANGQWDTWTSDRTEDQGEYPLSPSWVVEYTIPSGGEYHQENNITIRASYTDTRRQ